MFLIVFIFTIFTVSILCAPAQNVESGPTPPPSGVTNGQGAGNVGGNNEQNINSKNQTINGGYIIEIKGSGEQLIFPQPDNRSQVPADLSLNAPTTLGRDGEDIVLPHQIITNGYLLHIVGKLVKSNETAILANLGSKPQKAQNGARGNDGRSGSPESGESGEAGEPGRPGAPGDNGKSAGTVTISTKAFDGNLNIQLDGQPGGDGGNGGNGGQGGNGAQGTSSRSGFGMFGVGNCEKGPGQGGNGGPGGDAGHAASGGNGGDAGDLAIRIGELKGTITAHLYGGAPGDPGQPGAPGIGGQGGPEGRVVGYCKPAGRNGHGAGKGSEAPAASSAKPGKDGTIQCRIGAQEFPLVAREYRVSLPRGMD